MRTNTVDCADTYVGCRESECARKNSNPTHFGVLLLSLLILTGCNFIDQVNEHLQAMQGELQKKRALILAQDSFKQMDRVDIVFAVTPQVLQAISPDLLDRFNAAESARNNGLSFDSLEFVFGDQWLGVDAHFNKQYGEVTARVRTQFSAYIGATSNALHWNIYFDGIELVSLTGVPKVGRRVASEVAEAVSTLLPIINAVADEVVNSKPERALLTFLDQEDLININLTDSSSDAFKFDVGTIATGMKVSGTAILVDKRGIFVAAEVGFVKPSEVGNTIPTFPKDAELIRLSSKEWRKRLVEYQQAVNSLVIQSASREFAPLIDRHWSGFGVTKTAMSRLLQFSLAQDRLSGTAFLHRPTKSSADVTFEIKERNCNVYFEGCKYEEICSGDRCETTVARSVLDDACVGACCAAAGGVGCAIKKVKRGCKKACTSLTKSNHPIAGALCDGFRAADALHGGTLCKVADNVDVAICQLDENFKKSLCDMEQEVGRYFAKHPIGTMTVEIKPKVDIKLRASEATVSPDLTSFEATLGASGGGMVESSLRWVRKNYAGDVLFPGGATPLSPCITDWKESVTTKVALDAFHAHLRFRGVWSTDGDKKLVLTYAMQGDETVYVDLSPAPLVELFGGKPHVLINCPLVGFGSVVWGSAEGVFSQENARSVLPLLTGQDFPHNIENESFDLEIEPVEHCEDTRLQACEYTAAKCTNDSSPACKWAKASCQAESSKCSIARDGCSIFDRVPACDENATCEAVREKVCRQPVLRLEPQVGPASILMRQIRPVPPPTAS